MKLSNPKFIKSKKFVGIVFNTNDPDPNRSKLAIGFGSKLAARQVVGA